MSVRQRARVLVMALAVSMSVVALPGTALAGPCGDVQDVRTSGAEAHWAINCGGGGVAVVGWVKDTDADNQCAQVLAYFPADGSTKESPKACPKGNVKSFNLTGPGGSANVRLREIG
jgi:hypothetical protein